MRAKERGCRTGESREGEGRVEKRKKGRAKGRDNREGRGSGKRKKEIREGCREEAGSMERREGRRGRRE